MADGTKECIACAEIIKYNALLCKHCKTRQDDPSFSRNTSDANASRNLKFQVPDDQELFSSFAGFLSVSDDLSVFTYEKEDKLSGFLVASFNDFFFETQDLEKIEALLHSIRLRDFASTEWASIDDEDEEDDSQYEWHFEIPLLSSLQQTDFSTRLVDEFKGKLAKVRGFEKRKLTFYLFALERITKLLACQHKFKNPVDLDAKCEKCKLKIFDPEAYVELLNS